MLLDTIFKYILAALSYISLPDLTSISEVVSETASRSVNVRKPSGKTENYKIWRENAIHKRVGIIGGGIAGTTVLRNLLSFGFDDVILLEAQSKLGGRIKTFWNGTTMLEDGAQWIHGDEENVVYRIARRLDQIRPVPTEDNIDFRIKRGDGSFHKLDIETRARVRDILNEALKVRDNLDDYFHTGFGNYYIDRFRKEISQGNESNIFKGWFHFLKQSLSYFEGTNDWERISARDSASWKTLGQNFEWMSGYETLIEENSKSFTSAQVLLEAPVKHIFWDESDDRVLVVTSEDKSFSFEQVVITISVGCLKRFEETLFSPPLPATFKTLLQGIDLGYSNKIHIGWAQPWWGEKHLMTDILWTTHDLPPDKEWLYGIVSFFSNTKDKSILQMFITGDDSEHMESLDEEKVKNDVLFLMRRLFNEYTIPDPILFRRTQWKSNPWTCGSYGSFITTSGYATGIHTRKPFREPIKNGRNIPVIRWAGEHTHDSRYATVDGALMTGVREANELLKYINDAKQNT